ncbi:MAG: ribosome-binding factor A, partial [Pelistega sp.]|nr:ribosome-binding factor A [Pelistega sp.]
VLGAEPEVALDALNEKAGYLHSLLFKMLHIHTVPTLHFHHDNQLAHGIEMTKLIDRANRPEDFPEEDEVADFEPPKIRG